MPIVLTFRSFSGAQAWEKMENLLSLQPRMRTMAPVMWSGPAALGVPEIFRI